MAGGFRRGALGDKSVLAAGSVASNVDLGYSQVSFAAVNLIDKMQIRIGYGNLVKCVLLGVEWWQGSQVQPAGGVGDDPELRLIHAYAAQAVLQPEFGPDSTA